MMKAERFKPTYLQVMNATRKKCKRIARKEMGQRSWMREVPHAK